MDWATPSPRLEGAIVTLEPIDPAHEEGLFLAGDFDEVWKWLPLARPDRQSFSKVFDHLIGENAADRQKTWVTRAGDSGEVIGTSSMLALRPEHRGLEIGWTWLAPPHWRTGANAEAKLLMLDHAFAALECIRVEFKTDANNEPSRRALEALPATFEGIFRNHMVADYGVRDSAYYSVIEAEWSAVRANLERRIDR